MFVTDGGPIIYIVDENFKIQQEKIILDKNGRKVYSINELEYVVENGKPYIYANVYMERRIVKIDIEA
jgi:glutamine cyclotransferase